MRIISVMLMSVSLIACTEAAVEELAFRKTLVHDLTKLCGDNKECVQAVESQTKGCMEKSDWRKYLKNQDDPAELKRFTSDFYACIVDSEGAPYFESNL